jgi:hypothetical protein
MENETWGTNAYVWMSTTANTGANTISHNTIRDTIRGTIGGSTMTGITEPTLVLDNTSLIHVLKGSSYKRLQVSQIVLAENPFFAEIIAAFVVGVNCTNNRYKYEFAEGQLAALMEEYYFFKEETCTS